MDYKNHLKTGTMIGILFISSIENILNISPAELVVYSAGIVLGSALPDMDHPNSYIAKKLSFLGKIISRVFSHRGFTHSIFFIISLEFIRRYSLHFFKEENRMLFSYFMIGTIVASATHIFMDIFVGNGVKLFFPFIDKKIYISKIKAGTTKEKIFMKFIVIFFIIFLIYSESKK